MLEPIQRSRPDTSRTRLNLDPRSDLHPLTPDAPRTYGWTRIMRQHSTISRQRKLISAASPDHE
jgi:hypothetical protein